MSIFIRENPKPEPPLDDRNLCKLPHWLVLRDKAWQVCHTPTKEKRREMLYLMSFVETPEFMVELETEIRKMWKELHSKSASTPQNLRNAA